MGGGQEEKSKGPDDKKRSQKGQMSERGEKSQQK